jgi:hypothetical protein
VKNKVIVLGDSFTFGHGCEDREFYYDIDLKKWKGDKNALLLGPSQHCWTALAQQDFVNYEFQNLSFSGNSNDNMFRQLADTINETCALVLLACSYPDRILIKDPHQDDCVPWGVYGLDSGDTHLGIPTGYRSARTQFETYLYTEMMGQLHAQMSVTGVYGLAVANQSQFAWSFPDGKTSKHTLQFFSSMKLLDRFKFPSTHTYIFSKKDVATTFAKDGHLTAHGHELYYKAEIQPMLQRLLK